ncbi:MAG: TRAP transporter permease [Synergistaceae bacterium]|uniref:TRAP transporter permease n=1 Tax=Aminivibrio sp. TaxID=1872489 RepID=UPI00345E3214|nr:TRAP transporter permease [Synergistaceae bacterium]MDD4020887.1 TRAP transporter permease [Synergistaceae bacterium]MDD4611864.1 TRAP transporter permease [Synergistaceae bacterium]
MNVVDNEVKPVVDETCISLEGKTAPDGEDVLRKVDREARFRKNMQGFWKNGLIILSCIFIAYHLITSRFGMPPAFQHRAIHLGFILTLVWMYYPAGQKSITTRPSYIDMGLIVLTIGLTIFTYFNIDALSLRAGRAVSTDYIYGAFYILLVLEACRRVSGPGLLALAIIFLLYAYLGPYIPGVLSHRGYSVHRLIYQMYLTTQGIFGQPIGIAATYLVLFIVFSNLLGKSGLGSLFNDLAMAIGGGLTGGPAKVAVLASALVGMINGSSATNVATSGAFTIPLMKRVGYKPYFAGAVEAAASTGGQIMPPIMGTGAFIMAEFLGISYLTIAGAALIPAILYFAAVFFQIDLRARKIGLQGVCREDMPSVSKALKTYGHMIIPIFVLIYLLFEGYTPIYAAFYSCVFTWVLSLFRKETRMGVKELVDLSVTSARACVSLSVAMANAGFVVGVLSMTGIGIILADNIVALSHGSLLITLFLTMVVSIILGMGLPTSACYIIAASIAVPILREMGVVGLPAHMFVFYYACLSTVTPPVALSAYVGAGMAGADTNEVGWAALRLSLAGFIVPFFFVYAPEILLVTGTSVSIAWAAITGLIGTALLAVAMEGYFLMLLPLWLRSLFLVSAVTLMMPGTHSDFIGFGVTAAAVFLAHMLRKKKIAGIA